MLANKQAYKHTCSYARDRQIHCRSNNQKQSQHLRRGQKDHEVESHMSCIILCYRWIYLLENLKTDIIFYRLSQSSSVTIMRAVFRFSRYFMDPENSNLHARLLWAFLVFATSCFLLVTYPEHKPKTIAKFKISAYYSWANSSNK